MVDSAAGAVRCARIENRPTPPRRGAKVHSASGTGAFGPWRSCAARRVQMTVPAAASAIYAASGYGTASPIAAGSRSCSAAASAAGERRTNVAITIATATSAAPIPKASW
jgi:hypothetical protein